jgi:glycosyltransferase involved in cell wall biosynthesis
MGAMRLLYVADGRSPITSSWLRHFIERGDEVHLASTFSCEPMPRLASHRFIPVAFSSMKESAVGRPNAAGEKRGLASAEAVGLRTWVRHWLGPLTLRAAANQLRRLIDEIRPDLVHALRIPYEGMLAAEAYAGVPLAVSVWGNDFTLHGLSTPLMRHYTEWTLKVTNGLHADTQRDIRLARQWGLDPSKPALVTLTNGGLRLDIFHPPAEPVKEPVVINPRGVRAYVRNEAFFRAIPIVLKRQPAARFLCSSMAGVPQARQWVEQLGIGHAVQLLPAMPHEAMADVFRSAQVVVSPSIHDGSPNSLLEGMACGCFPAAGDIESIREWITPGRNGLLFDPNDPGAIADAILLALENENLRREAAGYNLKMLASRAEYGASMKQAEIFYEKTIAARG